MADIGTAYVKIEPTAKGITSKLKGEFESAGSESGGSFGGKFGSAVGTAMGGVGSLVASVTKVAAGAVAAGTAAVTGLATAAVSSYANYEQLVGGVEKLYGDAAGQVQKFADQAYKTSGMSANQYMETATSFSAALIGSLGGDVQKAAEMTDLAMRSMSDNVNVFGSDAQSVQNAYQGFAKQNYTMLDNLKLGYGGTKQEMQRLIDDANKWAKENGKAADLSIEKFSDVVTAIDYIQQSQNIAGTTAKEAMTTIEGSATATKAAWENVITAIGRGEGLSEAFNGLLSSVFGEKEGEGLLNQIIPRIQTVLESIGEFIGQAAPLFAEKIPELINAIVPSLVESGMSLISALIEGLMSNINTLLFTAGDIIEMFLQALVDATANGNGVILEVIADILGVFEENYMQFIDMGMEIITNILEGMTDNLSDIVYYASEIINKIVETLIEYAPVLIEAAGNIIITLATGIGESLPELIPSIVDVILTIVESLINNIDKLVDAAIAIITGLAEGLINALPMLVERLPEIIIAIVEGLVNNLPKLLEAAVQIIVALATGLIKSLPELISRLPEIIEAIVNGLIQGASAMADAGKELISGLWKGIKDNWDSLVSSVTELGSKLVDKVKSFFKIGSPSKLFADEIGKWIPEGVAVGIEANADSVNGAVEDMVNEAMLDPNYNITSQTASSITPSIASGVSNRNDDIILRIEGLLEKYLPGISNMDVVFDDGTLVGHTARKMNDALGQIAYAGAIR